MSNPNSEPRSHSSDHDPLVDWVKEEPQNGHQYNAVYLPGYEYEEESIESLRFAEIKNLQQKVERLTKDLKMQRNINERLNKELLNSKLREKKIVQEMKAKDKEIERLKRVLQENTGQKYLLGTYVLGHITK